MKNQNSSIKMICIFTLIILSMFTRIDTMNRIMKHEVDLNEACKVYGTCPKRDISTGAFTDFGAAAAGTLIGGPLGTAISLAPLAVRVGAKVCNKIKENSRGGKLEIQKVIWGPSKEQIEAVKKFNEGKEALVIINDSFNLAREITDTQNAISPQLLSLRRIFAQNGGSTTLTNPIYVQLLNTAIESPDQGLAGENKKVYISRLKQSPQLLSLLKRLAVLSSTVSTNTKFEDTFCAVVGDIANATQLALYLPLAEQRDQLNTDLNQEKREKNNLGLQLNQKNADIIEERDIRNRLQNQLNQSNTDLGQGHLQKQRLETELQTKNFLFNHYKGLYDVLTSALERKKVEFGELQLTRQTLETEREQQLAATEALSRQHAEQSQKAAEEYQNVRSQLSPLRTRAVTAEATLEQQRERDAQEFSTVFEQMMAFRRDLAIAQSQLRAKEEQLESLSTTAAQVAPLRRLNDELIKRLSEKKHAHAQTDTMPHPMHDLYKS